MTTLQPRLVRADTLDLQSHAAPSAQDHNRSPTFTPYTHGATGVHHREALRNAEESAYNERRTSPHTALDTGLGPVDHVHQYDSTDEDADDDQLDEQNDVAHQEDDDYEEGADENDDDLEDDLLDKISSSPSIEDGKYPHFIWPPRIDSISCEASLTSSSVPIRGNRPFPLCPLPLDPRYGRQMGNRRGCRLSNSNFEAGENDHSQTADLKSCTVSTTNVNETNVGQPLTSKSCAMLPSTELDDISRFLFSADDPFLQDLDCMSDVGDDRDQEWLDEGDPWYEDESSSDDDLDDFEFSCDSRFVDSGWGGECLRDAEDIDFEFVYALHTFVATVEGQANATKGDTMVLLDDSNSYWWLVRVVKDGSIGYLPAEHIETPTERLARLNKHRNIDLSASMLGDNPEKSKNPLKKAMRRRNAKTVTFAAPTYYEPSEYDYDTEEEGEEEEDGEGFEGDVDSQQQNVQQSEVGPVDDAPSVDTQESIVVVNGIKQVSSDEQMSVDAPSSPVKTENISPTSAQAQLEESLQRSRNGVVRNTDSFFKDDTTETKKISLTPRLLRNESDSANASEQDLRSKASSDTFDKMLSQDEKTKEKKKEKRGVLSGLFKRKDKTAKVAKNEAEEDRAEETSRPGLSKDSPESTSAPQSPEKKPGKLQKHQINTVASPKTSPTEIRQVSNQASAATSPVHSPKTSGSAVSSSDPRRTLEETAPVVNQVEQPEPSSNRLPSSTEKRSVFSPIANVLKPTLIISHDQDPANKPVLLKRAKERFAIDTSDSEDDQTPTMSLTTHENQPVSPIRNSQLLDARPDSAMEVSPLDPSEMEDEFHDLDNQPTAQTPNNITGEHDIHGTPQSDTASTSKPSPSLATHTPSTSRSTPTWSDASLRSYMDSDQDIRDLLIIVHDKSNVTPVGPDHPLLGGLFMTERTRLAEMQTQLDSMLTSWISKKSSRLVTR